MTLSVNNQSRVPPGFRFHPTEEELLYYYLKKKVSFEKIDLDVIRDVDLNKLEPWELQERCRIGSTPQNDWYFFSHKDKKYPTGTRTNRATAAGFWKATGRDKPIHTNFKKIGMRKTLVFYKGRAPHGQKTDWIMHEYRLEDTETPQTNNSMGDQQEDGWVVCRVFKKRNHQRGHEPAESKQYGSSNSDFMEKQILIDQDNTNYQDQMSLCKTELIPSMQYGNNFTNDHFMQLPQLESPKMLSPSTTPDQSLSTSGMKRYLQEAFTTNSNTINKRPCYPFDMGEFNPQCTTSTSEYKPQVEETPHVRDWTFVDRLVASHLNQEDPSKDIRSLFSNCNNTTTTNPTAAEQNLIGADTSFPLRMPRINAQDYGCDVDLWNFAK